MRSVYHAVDSHVKLWYTRAIKFYTKKSFVVNLRNRQQEENTVFNILFYLIIIFFCCRVENRQIKIQLFCKRSLLVVKTETKKKPSFKQIFSIFITLLLRN
jgi:hypothetical protein